MTVYVTGFVKSLAVEPLVCVVEPTLTDAPVVVKVATRCLTSVPEGTVTEMVCASWSMAPRTTGFSEWKLKAVIALAELGAEIVNATLELQGPAPAELLPRTFQVRATVRGRAAVVVHLVVVTPVFFTTSLLPW